MELCTVCVLHGVSVRWSEDEGKGSSARDGAPLHADEITSSTAASLEVVIVGESSPTTAI